MSVFEKIYEAFIAGELSIQPSMPLKENRDAIVGLEHRLGLSSDEQRDELRDLVLEIAEDYGKKMFKAGLVLSQELAKVSE